MAHLIVRYLVLSFLCLTSVCWSYSVASDGRVANASTIFYELFTKLNSTVPQILRLGDVTALKNSNFNSALPTKIYFHGWTGDARKGYEARDQYLKQEDCNYISTDWSVLASGPQPYPSDYPFIVRDNVPLAGQHSGAFIEFLIRETGAPISSFHLIGHSLGAHVAGEAGENVTSGKLPRITGLDPAGPGFSLNDTDNRLDITDAKFVDIIHTDGGRFVGDELGFIEPIGHVDFYPNGGKNQPECQLRSACDHDRAPTYYAESVTSPVGFRAVECATWEDFQAGLCNNNTTELMGYPTPTTARGIYYLQTNAVPPYAMG